MGDSLNCESTARQRVVSKLKSAGQKLKSVGQKVIEATRKTVSEFLQSSSIHGLQYIGTRSLKEKICWIAVIIASMTVCCFQIQEVYQKWRENPIIISYDQKLQSVTDVPFPAVTVCLPLVINGSSFDFVDTLLKLNYSDKSESNQRLVKVFNMVSTSCIDKTRRDIDLWHTQDFYFGILKNFNIENENDSTLSPLFKIIDSDLEKVVLKRCRGVFGTDFIDDCKLEFQTIDTPEGACFSFNLLDRYFLLTENTVMGFDEHGHESPKYWSLEDGYTDDGIQEKRWQVFPYKTYEHNRGFEFDLEFEPWDSLFKCFDKPHLYIHHPHDFPWLERNRIDLSDGYKIKISVTPEIFFTDASLRTSSTPEQRQCYFDDEVQLRYFKVYSESNCRLECLSNLTHGYQKPCVAFWMPRDKEMRVCNASEVETYIFIVDRINTGFFSDVEESCLHCLPRCNSITYTNLIADRSKVKYDFTTKLLHTPNMLEIPFFDNDRAALKESKADDLDRKRLEIVFAKSHVLALKRSPRYQSFDFIASIGGLLGLFIGMSLLSLVEVLYFLTVRLIEQCRRQR